eukprot:TRINITY_DN2441_c0_g2_i3.p1 TRINITY_DN2441_c0_g2~~TRINITY_DN2441_c0_g2_i3.p1  ORF type:complete len:247 (+),score=48.31 TRINITY_DN2441_c0_g2_i3:133-873(+)
MNLNIIILCVILCVGLVPLYKADWDQCYSEDASTSLKINRAHLRIVPTIHGVLGVEIYQNITASNDIHSGRWTLEFWQESTGNKLRYKGSGFGGPYDICCGFLVGSKCSPFHSYNYSGEPTDKDQVLEGQCEYDCPIALGTTFETKVVKPLFKTEEGNYEVTFRIWDDQNEELSCVVLPFRLTVGMDGITPQETGDDNVLKDEVSLDLEVKNIDEEQESDEKSYTSKEKKDEKPLLLLGPAEHTKK